MLLFLNSSRLNSRPMLRYMSIPLMRMRFSAICVISLYKALRS
nr:MAG TPA: hypothetical protein [Crassvirales sp.]